MNAPGCVLQHVFVNTTLLLTLAVVFCLPCAVVVAFVCVFSYSVVYVREPTSNVSVRLIVSASALLCPHELGFRIGAGGHGTSNV